MATQTITLNKELLVQEDIDTGFGTVSQTRGIGTKINSSSIPHTISQTVSDVLNASYDASQVDSLLDNKADIGGNALYRFKANNASTSDEVVTLGQVTTSLVDKADKVYVDSSFPLSSNVLEKGNTLPFLPVLDYDPVTKKYVDDTLSTGYVLPTSSSTVQGGTRLFSDIVQSVVANTVSSVANKTYGLQFNSSGQLVVNVPWVDTIYTHPTTDGNLHVPATSTTNNGKVLTAGATAGSFSWQTPTSGVTDHTLLSNIGTNTHTQIDTALTRLANTSGTNTGDQDLSGYSLTSHNHTVDGLSNVVITTNSDNEILAWDSATSKWINQTASEAGLATSSHTHTGVYEPADATILKDADIGVTVQAYNANTTTAGNTFNGASQLVQLNGTGQLPAIDGSLLTGITGGATTLDGLSDVVITTPSTGQVVKYNGTNWINDTDATGSGSSTLTIQDKTTAYTVVAGDLATIINCTSGTFTVSLTAVATLGAGFNCTIWNTSSTDTDTITIDPNGAETIDGIATVILRRGEGTQIVSDGTNWQLGSQKELRGYADNIHPTSAKPIATGNSAVAIHVSATASGANSIALGRSSTSSGSYAFSTSLSTASSTNSTAIGVNSSSSGSQAVTGAGAMALGGSYASGTDSFAAAIANNTSTYGATGANSVAIGLTAKATNSYAIGIGYLTQATGFGAVAIHGYGSSALASGNYSLALGGSATKNHAKAIGGYSNFIGKMTMSGNGTFGSNATPIQRGIYFLAQQTTNETPTKLSPDKTALTADNQFGLENNSAYTFTGTVIARQSSAQGTASAAWKVEGLIRREGTAATTTLVASTVTAISNVPAWALTLSADTTNGGLAVTFTGAAAMNIRTVATVETSEVIYA